MVNTNSAMPASCLCGSPNFTFGPVEGGYFLECHDCDVDLLIPPDLLTIGERQWLTDKGS